MDRLKKYYSDCYVYGSALCHFRKILQVLLGQIQMSKDYQTELDSNFTCLDLLPI